jgi:hypothetical protein
VGYINFTVSVPRTQLTMQKKITFSSKHKILVLLYIKYCIRPGYVVQTSDGASKLRRYKLVI